MPFTFSHPAIVLPLTFLPRRWFSLTGLVIGSLTPDFEYFLRMRVKSAYSHTLNGVFWFDMPLGLMLAFMFHNIVRNSLFDNLPTFLKSRFVVFQPFDWNRYFRRNWFVVVISILIGVVSHVFWDSFTHNHGYFVQKIPALAQSISFFFGEVQILKMLQHGSTLIGGCIIAFSIYKLPAEKTEKANVSLMFWIIVSGLTLIIIAIRLLNGLGLKQYGNVLATAISAGLISIVVASWLTSVKKIRM